MKKVSFLFVVLFLVNGIIMAQGPRGGNGRNADPKVRAERMTERMVKEYALNDAQKKQVYEANLAFAEKMNSSQPTKEAKEKERNDMKSSQEEHNAKLKSIMTDEQFAAYTKNQNERQKRGEGRPKDQKR